VPTSAVSQVEIKYTDMNGVQQTKTGSLSGGKATFSGLTFYVLPVPMPHWIFTRMSAPWVPSARPSRAKYSAWYPGYRQHHFTFNAVGSSSSNTVNNAITFVGMAGVNQYMVRKSVPTFAKASG